MVNTFLFLISCSPVVPEWVQDIRFSDYAQVELREYPYLNEVIKEGELETYDLKEEIEKHVYILEEILYQFFPQENPGLKFRYRFTSQDRENNAIIFNYFASIPNPKVYAGYLCQLVFDSDSLKFKKMYLKKIPLDR